MCLLCVNRVCVITVLAVFLRVGPVGDMDVWPRQPEPVGGEPAGQRDPQRLRGGAVWIRPGPSLSGFTGGRGQWSVSGCQLDLASKQRLERPPSVFEIGTDLIFFYFFFLNLSQERWGNRDVNQHQDQSQTERCVLWLLKLKGFKL